MLAAWYEKQGAAHEVLRVGERPVPIPGAGEIRVRVSASGVNPGEVKKRSDAFGVGMPYPRVIPHSDGAGIVDMLGDNVGDGVASDWMGRRVWCYGAQSYRAFGTAAQWVVVPERQVAVLPDGISMQTGACLGIPGITGYQAVHAGGDVAGKTVLIQGGAGAVGQCAVALAKSAGAQAIATVRSERDETIAAAAGAHSIVRTDGRSPQQCAEAILDVVPEGVDHMVEVAFHANIFWSHEVLKLGGSIGTYATGNPEPTIPFWPLVFKNIRLYFLGSDDFSEETKRSAADALNRALRDGWAGPVIGSVFALEDIADAHRAVEDRTSPGKVVLTIP